MSATARPGDRYAVDAIGWRALERPTVLRRLAAAETPPVELTDELAFALRSLVLGALRAALGPDHDLTATVAVTDEGFGARVELDPDTARALLRAIQTQPGR